MIDWQWIPGVLLGGGATAHTLWLRARFDSEIIGRAQELQRQIMDQYQHGLQLWPRPWLGGRPLTQVEEITKPGYAWDGYPLAPEDQLRKMQEDAERILDSYRPRGGETDAGS